MSDFNLGRRRVMQAVGAGLLLPGLAPAVIASVKDRPQLTDGVQSGDLLGDRAMIWSRSDRPARMVVEWDTGSLFGNPRKFVSPLADARSDGINISVTMNKNCVKEGLDRFTADLAVAVVLVQLLLMVRCHHLTLGFLGLLQANPNVADSVVQSVRHPHQSRQGG